uniref:Bm13376 n=1 Tax=Brugia malayi TaxID=6279 RepID=A0A1I9G0A0_BRUMA|nr:Bm13376 [Brugia malayi]
MNQMQLHISSKNNDRWQESVTRFSELLDCAYQEESAIVCFHITLLKYMEEKRLKICCTSRFYSTFGLNRSSMSVTSRVRRILIHRSE